MDVVIEASWKKALSKEFENPYFEELAGFVRAEYLADKIYPPPKLIFNAFNLCPFDKIRVVILGQDPYHGPGQAHGLCFSVPNGVTLPPSLKNIYKEIGSDLGVPTPTHGNLEHWARQGVFLLNATLTVAARKPMSHHGRGWEQFTSAVIQKLSSEREHLVFLLWGRSAQEKGSIIDAEKHLILTAPHPSPFSADKGFFGCRHFSAANEYLTKHGLTPIRWVKAT
jgi:uracil-DNA glycosylase